MLYSRMNSDKRKQIVEQSENYPLRVSFLGKTGLLSPGEVAFLRSRGVEFDVDDSQVQDILLELAEQEETDRKVEIGSGEREITTVSENQVMVEPPGRIGPILAIVAVLFTAVALLRRAILLFSRR